MNNIEFYRNELNKLITEHNYELTNDDVIKKAVDIENKMRKILADGNAHK